MRSSLKFRICLRVLVAYKRRLCLLGIVESRDFGQVIVPAAVMIRLDNAFQTA